MRKDIRKRLEKALITLKEPGGSTIRSIIKVINKEGPILSLRKVLEVLQQGINEGFLCMYNGRFKLKQQMQNGRFGEENLDRKTKNQCSKEVKKRKSPKAENAETEFESEDDAEVDFRTKNNAPSKRKINRGIIKSKQVGVRGRNRPTAKTKNKGFLSKRSKKKSTADRGRRVFKKYHMDTDKAECDSILEMSPNMPEKKFTRPTAEKPDVKKQRGPRCTSMKKDIRMPSKVHIPFVPPSVPQKSNTFNDLLRRSPEPVNGPLFDSFVLTTDNFPFFGV